MKGFLTLLLGQDLKVDHFTPHISDIKFVRSQVFTHAKTGRVLGERATAAVAEASH